MRKIIFALAFGALLLPDYGFTLGLGEIEVSTALNQELNAEIELLSAAPEDVDTLIVKLASREEFSRAGIDRPYMLNSLKFNAEIKNGSPIIRVTSDKPIREPFLNFLVEIDWPKGHMMREYTILLDPPVFMGQDVQAPSEQGQTRPAALDTSSPAATSQAPAPQSSGGFRPGAMGSTSTGASTVPVPATQTAPAPQAQAVPSYAQTSYQAPGTYRIKHGDTLWSLADSLRPDQTVTVEQMMLAMLRSNPEAFIKDNINGLKRGYILRIPDRDDIMTLNQAEAIALVREQHALWREYQQALTGAEPTSAMDREADGSAGEGFEQDADARLEIVAAGSGVSASGSKDPTQMSDRELRAELAIARESLETERVEKEELQQRVEALEGQVEKMKSLLTLEDSDLAEMQQAVTPTEGETMPLSGMEQDFVDQQADVIEELASDLDAVAEDAAVTEQGITEDAADQEEVFVEDEQLEVDEEIVEQPITSSEDFTVAPSTQPAFMDQQKGPLAGLFNNPMMLAAAGGGLLVVLLLIALIMKRRKAGDEDEPVIASNLDGIGEQLEEDDVVAESEQAPLVTEVAAVEAVADTAVEAVEDTEQVRETNQADELPSADDTVVTPPAAEAVEEPRDDVIAEADVYLAYGIYQQAEELLENAVKQKPDNDSYRVKLAETYLASKNSDAFIEMATDMNQRRAGKDTAAWKKIVAVGTQLCPEHALFKDAAADMVGELSMDELASSEPEPMDIDLGAEEEPEALATDLDFGLDESDVASESTESVEFDLSETDADAVAETIDESVAFDLSETGADTVVEAAEESVEFDLSETGAETAIETAIETEQEGVEFGLDETQAFETEQAEAEDEAFTLDIDATELGIEEDAIAEEATGVEEEFELDLSAEAEETLLADTDEVEEEFSLDDVDMSSLDLDATDEVSAEAVVPEASEIEAEQILKEAEQSLEEAASLDIGEMGLDESVVESAADLEITGVGAETVSFADADDEFDLSELDDIDEVGTKLDLAKAYLDMGDADGTRSILDEVMTEGDDTQKKEAEELLRQIG